MADSLIVENVAVNQSIDYISQDEVGAAIYFDSNKIGWRV